MKPGQESAKSRDMEPTRVGSPPQNYLDTLTKFWQYGVAKSFEICERSRTIRPLRSSLLLLAAPPYGDFIPGVGRAYRMSAFKRPATCNLEAFGTSSEGDAPKGLNRENATVPEHGFPWGQVPYCLETNRLPAGYRVTH